MSLTSSNGPPRLFLIRHGDTDWADRGDHSLLRYRVSSKYAAYRPPIPRHYLDAGIRRFGFDGLSFTYLMGELNRLAGPETANGRIILAHLGSGASMAAVRGGKPVDTTMAFTPTSGLLMGSRPGDLDPGLLVYLMRVEKQNADQMDDFISSRCGLLGVSDTSSDMRDLEKRRAVDQRAADGVDLFCYQAKKFVGALTTALGGLDFTMRVSAHSSASTIACCCGLLKDNLIAELIALFTDAARRASMRLSAQPS